MRITIPEGHVALVVTKPVADDIKAMCFLIRKGRKYSPQEKNSMHSIAGDLLLALLEADNDPS